MKFLYVIACCMMLSSHNLHPASEIKIKSIQLESDWLIADDQGNSQEAEKPVITIKENQEFNPDAHIIEEVDAIAKSMYDDALAIWSSVLSLFTDDDSL